MPRSAALFFSSGDKFGLAAKLDMGLGAAALCGLAAIQSVLCPADKGPNADDAKKQLVNGCLVRRPDFAKRA